MRINTLNDCWKRTFRNMQWAESRGEFVIIKHEWTRTPKIVTGFGDVTKVLWDVYAGSNTGEVRGHCLETDGIYPVMSFTTLKEARAFVDSMKDEKPVFPYVLASVRDESVRVLGTLDNIYAHGSLQFDLGYDVLGIDGVYFVNHEDIPQFEGVYNVRVRGAKRPCILYIWKGTMCSFRNRGFVVYADDADDVSFAEKRFSEKRQLL